MAKKNASAPGSALAQLMASMAPKTQTQTPPPAPAATAPLPAWIDAARSASPDLFAAVQAKAAPAAPAVKVLACLTRSWSVADLGASEAGNPWLAFASGTASGRTFRVTVPMDLLAFILANQQTLAPVVAKVLTAVKG